MRRLQIRLESAKKKRKYLLRCISAGKSKLNVIINKLNWVIKQVRAVDLLLVKGPFSVETQFDKILLKNQIRDKEVPNYVRHYASSAKYYLKRLEVERRAEEVAAVRQECADLYRFYDAHLTAIELTLMKDLNQREKFLVIKEKELGQDQLSRCAQNFATILLDDIGQSMIG